MFLTFAVCVNPSLTAVGVASPSAQGQATLKTLTKFSSEMTNLARHDCPDSITPGQTT